MIEMRPRSKNAHQGAKNDKVKGAQKTKKTTAAKAPQPLISKQLPMQLLQLMLDIFRVTFSSRFDPSLPDTIQQVKRHLYNRDFDNAFGREDFLEAYSMRWSPSRALAYANVFYNLPLLTEVLTSSLSEFQCVSDGVAQKPPNSPVLSLEPLQDTELAQRKSRRIVCIGAGAGAEIVALGAFLNHLENYESDGQKRSEKVSLSVDVQVLDIADWKSNVSRLYNGSTLALSISPDESKESKAAHQPVANPNIFKLNFLQQDVLHMDMANLATTFTDSILVTFMFTLNELYNASVSATTNLLLALTMLLSSGALLLVIDSPGSYSTVQFNSSTDKSKQYPMQWLLDHTLLESAAVGSSKNSTAGGDQWEKIEARESEWFRLPKELEYPIDLEDMRFQLHLYRRL